MIKYDLKCSNDHVFESWFKDSGNCDILLEGNMVECPICGDTHVNKAIMAPNINTGKTKDRPPSDAAIQHVRDNIEYVGEKFAVEVKQMHCGEKDEKSIIGTITKKEIKELKEHGVDFEIIKPKKTN